MLSPDVVNIRSSIRQESVVKSGKLKENTLNTQLKSNLEAFGNIHEIKIIVPLGGQSETLQKMKDVLTEDTEYYEVDKGFDISVIFDKTFHHNFIKSGDLSLSSANKYNNINPCKAISLSGNLLSVTLPRDDMLSNCLAQTVKKKFRNKNNFVHFQQNTKSSDLKSSQVENIKSHTSILATSVACTWCHPDKSICPSTLASFLVDKGMQVQVKSILLNMHVSKNVQIPTMEKEEYCDWDDNYVADVEEWLGGVCLQLPDEILPAPSPSIPADILTCVQALGLFTTNTILKLMSTITVLMGNMPWVSVSLLGPSYGTLFKGDKCLETSDSVITVIMNKQGEWVMRLSRSVDYSNAKPSKYA